MLDPFRPHGYGASLLKAFLSAAVANPTQLPIHVPLTGIETHLLDLGDAEIRREWRNIDLLIIISEIKLVVAIELKIDSMQHSDQLRRYRQTVEDQWAGWSHLFVFLTKNDEAPNDYEHWLPVKLSDLITSFEKRSVGQAADPLAAEMLTAYVKMMRRRHLEDRKIDEIVRKLWATHGEVLGFLADRRPDEVGEAFELLRDRTTDILTMLGANWVLDSVERSIIRFAYVPWDVLPGFQSGEGWGSGKRIILFELKRVGNELNGTTYLAPGNDGVRQRVATALASIGKIGRKGKWSLIEQRHFVRATIDMTADANQLAQAAKAAFAAYAKTLAAEIDPVVRQALS